MAPKPHVRVLLRPLEDTSWAPAVPVRRIALGVSLSQSWDDTILVVWLIGNDHATAAPEEGTMPNDPPDETTNLPAKQLLSQPELAPNADGVTRDTMGDPEATGLHTPGHNTVSRGAGPAKVAPFPVIDGYVIESELGRGGMGVVYKARHLRLKRPVALKIMRGGPGASPDELERFRAEAEAVAAVQHPGIVQIYEVGEHAGGPYCALEFVDGGSLAAKIGGHPLPPAEAAGLVESLARAIHHAHQKGIVHRDLKPANVLLSADGVPKVTDFGLAKRLEGGDSGLTRTGAIMGTPAYMAPEQAKGDTKDVGPAADIYALGAILFELLTGRPPFTGPTVMSTLQMVLNEEPQPPSKLAPGTPRDIETVCLKCLAKQPARRYASALGLAQDLERFRAGEPILARREGLIHKVLRKARKRAVPITLVVAVALGAVAAAWGVRSSERARESAGVAHRFDSEIDSPDWSEARRDELEQLAEKLTALDPERGEVAQRRLTDRVAARVRDVLQQPRVSAADVAGLEGDLVWLARRQPEASERLRADAARRLRDWQTVVRLEPPFASVASAFRTGDVRSGPDAIRRVETTSAIVPTLLSSRGKVRLVSTFGAGWEAARELGIVMHHRPGAAPNASPAGYTFVLVATLTETGDDGKPAAHSGAPPDFQRTGRNAELRIVRNGAVLQRAPVALPPGPVQLLAERDGDRLRLQVNNAPPVTFTDSVPLLGDEHAVFGLIWPDAVPLNRLQAEASALPPEASTLERADELYDRGRPEDALALYREQARTGGSVAAEAQCKAGFCLTALGRTEEAAQTFEEVMGRTGERWPVIAATQLWVIRLREKRFADADAVFAAVSVRFTRDHLAQYVPAAVREELGRAESIPAMNYMMPDPKMLPKLEAQIRLVDLLRLHDITDYRGQQVIALALNRDYNRAAKLAEQNVRDAIARWDSHDGATEHLFWGARWNCWARRAMGEPKFATDTVEQYIAACEAKSTADPGSAANVRRTVAMLRLEQARSYAATGMWAEAETAVDACLRDYPKPVGNYTFYSQPYLLKGFFAWRNKDEKGAREWWARGTFRAYLEQVPPANRSADRVPPGSWGLLDHWVMASLADEMSDADATAVSAALLAKLSTDPLMTQVGSTLQFSPATIRGAWRSPRGRELARQLAFMESDPVEHFRLAPKVLVYEKLRQDLFAGAPTDEQDEVTWQGVERIGRMLFDGKLTKSQVLQLAMAWKGTVGSFGWGGLAPALAPEARAPFAYLLGVRYLKLNKPADAKTVFRVAVEAAPAGSPVRTLAEVELRRLEPK